MWWNGCHGLDGMSEILLELSEDTGKLFHKCTTKNLMYPENCELHTRSLSKVVGDVSHHKALCIIRCLGGKPPNASGPNTYIPCSIVPFETLVDSIRLPTVTVTSDYGLD